MSQTGELNVTTPSDREIVMTRHFDAPRALVFDAWTKPERLKRWLLGPPGWSMAVCEVDLRVGGAYRFQWRHDERGTEVGLGGVYREIVPPERLQTTEQFDEPWYPGGALVTLVLTERDGGTESRTTVLYDTQEARDIAAGSGMAQGVAHSYDRLEAMLAGMASGA